MHGTLLNVVIISVAIELSLPYLPQPDSYLLQVVEASFGILLVGFGSGLYLIANLGPGPRDGLMTGLQRVSNLAVSTGAHGYRNYRRDIRLVVGWNHRTRHCDVCIGNWAGCLDGPLFCQLFLH